MQIWLQIPGFRHSLMSAQRPTWRREGENWRMQLAAKPFIQMSECFRYESGALHRNKKHSQFVLLQTCFGPVHIYSITLNRFPYSFLTMFCTSGRSQSPPKLAWCLAYYHALLLYAYSVAGVEATNSFRRVLFQMITGLLPGLYTNQILVSGCVADRQDWPTSQLLDLLWFSSFIQHKSNLSNH